MSWDELRNGIVTRNGASGTSLKVLVRMMLPPPPLPCIAWDFIRVPNAAGKGGLLQRGWQQAATMKARHAPLPLTAEAAPRKLRHTHTLVTSLGMDMAMPLGSTTLAETRGRNRQLLFAAKDVK